MVNKEQRKKILLLADDLRVFSGIGSVSRELILGTAHHFSWCNLGAAISHPEAGKKVILNDEINKIANLTDSDVSVYPFNGYGNPFILRELIQIEKPDMLMIFTDPRYFTWLFVIEDEIRAKIPMVYLNIWDDVPYPYYNHSYYKSCDLLFGISKQTKNVNKQVLSEENIIDLDKELKYEEGKRLLSYLPHGINDKINFPITNGHPLFDSFNQFKYKFFDGNDYEFVLFWNNRNIRRKQPADVILSWKEFNDLLTPEQRKKCVLIMHTQPVDENGTDLPAVVRDLCGENPECNIIFSSNRISNQELNFLYNLSTAYITLSNNEGWGLGVTEALMVGKPIIATVTGGMQDQMRFEDEEGKWIEFDRQFGSNNCGKYKKHGSWAFPIFPSSISLQGSVPTPYIFEDRISIKDVVATIYKLYKMDKAEIEKRGSEGRNWVLGDESGMNIKSMCSKFIKHVDFLLENWKPREKYNFSKIEYDNNPRNSDVSYLLEEEKQEILKQ